MMVISRSGHNGVHVIRVVDSDRNFVNDGVPTLHRLLVVEIVWVKCWRHNNVTITLVQVGGFFSLLSTAFPTLVENFFKR